MGRLARIIINGVTGVGLIDGLASVFMPPGHSCGGTAVAVSLQEAWEQDARAIRSDWQRVGNDIRSAMVAVSGEISNV